jgi:apolipoprotein N-acyltransferase
VYGLTVFIVLLAVGTEAISRAGFLQKWLVPVYAGGLLIGISFISFPIHTSIQNESTTRVISITTQFNSSLLATTEGAQKKAEILAIAVNQATKRNPDFILLPEDSRYLESLTQNQNPIQAMQFFQFTHAGTGSILIDSGRLELPTGETVLRASIFDGHSKLLYQFDKQYLVPQGEYVPTLYGAFMSGLGYGNLIRAIARDSAYRPGPLKQAPVIPEYIPGILFCFESVRPNGVAALMARRPLPFIAHPISHGWFHSSEILRQQLDVMLRIQARQSGLPIVSAGNMASSKLYTPQGEIERGSIVGSGESFELSEFIF